MTNGHIICGDSLQILQGMPDDSVDAVVTDPPYGVDIAPWDVAPTQEFVDECLRIATGPVVMFGAAARRSQEAFMALQWERELIWAVAFTMSKTSADGMYYKYHPIYCWRLPTEHNGPHADVLRYSTDRGDWWTHNCSKPEPLMCKLVGFALSDGIVLDPFIGSGTTAVACVQTGRRYIGIDISEEYCQMARDRIAKAEAQPRLLEPEREEPVQETLIGGDDGKT